jgi:hypothetical protein
MTPQVQECPVAQQPSQPSPPQSTTAPPSPDGPGALRRLPGEYGTWTMRRARFPFGMGVYRLGVVHVPSYYQSEPRELPDESAPPELFWRSVPPEARAISLLGCPLKEALPRLTRLPAAIRYVPWQYKTYVVRLGASFEDHLGRLSRRVRTEARRKLRRFDEQCGGRWELRLCRTPREMLEFYLMARDVSRRCYQERLYNTGLPNGPKFLANTMSAARAGSAVGALLLVDGEPIAFASGAIVGRRLCYESPGYDERMAHLSPGTVLMLRLLQAVTDQRLCDVVDFGPGDQLYKTQYATEVAFGGDVHYLRPTRRHRALVRLHSLNLQASHAPAELARKLHAYNTLRRGMCLIIKPMLWLQNARAVRQCRRMLRDCPPPASTGPGGAAARPC